MLWLFACAEPETTDTEPELAEETGTTTVDTGDPELPTTGDTGAEVDESWERFLETREAFLVDLGEPILDCVARQDTYHPAFHGCIDWHSAVHGTWALHVLYDLTGDGTYLDAADAVLEPGALALELQDMQQGDIDQELPYGFSWLLLLARERERTTGDLSLIPLADEAYARLSAFVTAIPLQQIDSYVLDEEYSNLSWAILQLWEQAVWNGDTAEQARWESLVRAQLMPLDDACPLEDDAQSFGFFPPCFHRARTIVTVMPSDEAADWMVDFLPQTLSLPPLTSFPNPHQAGQNFSRSWGLWALWEASGDVRYRNSYIAHVTTHMAQPEYWAENYSYYSHWVAQFGVYGVALSYE